MTFFVSFHIRWIGFQPTCKDTICVKEQKFQDSDLCIIIIIVGSGRVPNQALCLKGNWAAGNELGLTCLLEERPSGQWAVRERKLNHPTYLKGENNTEKWIPCKR